MRNLILAIAALTIIGLSACKKNAKVIPSSKNVFSATIDGKTEDFTIKDTIRNPGSSSIYISGTNAATKDRIFFFADTTNKGTSTTAEMLFEDGSISPGAGGYDGYYYGYNYQEVNYSGSVTFTAITDTLISGTFNGHLIAESSVVGTTGLATKTISNGKFSLYLQSVVLQNQ